MNKYFIEVEYNDNSSFSFDVIVEGKEHQVCGILLMVTRGVLMTSMATKATCYNYEGFPICSYLR